MVIGRVGYRYDLEWMEGGMVDHVLRLLHAKPLYTEPTLDFAPFIYNPLFYELGAVTSTLLGPGPVALRCVSVAASVLLLGLVVHLVRAVSGRLIAGIAAAAAFLATYALSGGWLDLARVDATFLALTLAAISRARSRQRFALGECAGLVCAAFFTKQYAIAIAAPIAFYFSLRDGLKAAVQFTICTSALTGGSVLLLSWLSDGWYWFWTFRVPQAHGSWGKSLSDTLRDHLIGPLPLLLVIALAGAAVLVVRAARAFRARTPRDAADSVLVLGSAGVFLLQAWLSWDHPGSFLNCLMPAHLALALLSGVAVGETLRFRWFVSVPVALALVVQLSWLRYSPAAWIPNAADRKAAAALEQRLLAAKGTLMLPFRGFYGAVGVNPPHAHQMALLDLFSAGLPRFEARLRKQAARRWATSPIDEALLDNPDYVFLPELEAHLQKTSEVAPEAEPGGTRSGSTMRPRIVYKRPERATP